MMTISNYRDSFGYDCARRRNLAVLDECTLLFVTGNLLHFLDLETNELSMKRSVGGSGISCIAVSLKKFLSPPLFQKYIEVNNVF